MGEVFVQGEFVDRDAARVSAFDAGIVHGVGLFETLSAVVDTPGEAGSVRLAFAEEHLRRLRASCEELGLGAGVNQQGLIDALKHTAARSGLGHVRLRLTLTGGDLNLLRSGLEGGVRPTVIIDVQPMTRYPAELFERGAKVVIADAKANPFDPTAGHKTLNYWWRLRELQRAAAGGADEALVLQVSQHLCGGCVSNVCVVRGRGLVTPIARGEEVKGGLPSPVLPGVTRRVVMDLAQSHGLDVKREMLSVADVLDADEAFLTNSSWGVLPVTRVEGETVGSGEVGPVTRELRLALEAAAGREYGRTGDQADGESR